MEDQTAVFSLLELFQLGGVTMWPLTLYSIATITIGIERAIFFAKHDLKLHDLGREVSARLAAGDWAGAKGFLEPLTAKRVGARVILAMLKSAEGKTFSEGRTGTAAESEASDCIVSLESGLNFLVALGSIAPLTGFLGTVTGMIGAFRSIAEATEVNAQIVAGGIYEALITTVYGLLVAIFAMVFHTVFSHLVDGFASRTERTCSGLLAEMVDLKEGK
ncbi:MAG: MotA/TolQ/ExbB proton channel family protein [Treponema sp.]|nr:MotA/TolQ/ExbB proton channel family protein [Treponema sp.]